jgi:hypothetical protein
LVPVGWYWYSHTLFVGITKWLGAVGANVPNESKTSRKLQSTAGARKSELCNAMQCNQHSIQYDLIQLIEDSIDQSNQFMVMRRHTLAPLDIRRCLALRIVAMMAPRDLHVNVQVLPLELVISKVAFFLRLTEMISNSNDSSL